jgi:hypothetical protein
MGDGHPISIALDCLTKLPTDFQDIKDFNGCWFADTDWGWNTRYLLSRWAILLL